MKKFLLKFSVYFFIIFIIVNMIAGTSLYLHRKSSMFKPSFLKNNFSRSQEFDYIILGGSTGLTTLNSILIDSVCNTNGLNLSEDDTGAGSYLLMLQFFLSNGYKTKSVILTADPGRLNQTKSGISSSDYRMLPFIGEDHVFEYFHEREEGVFKFRAYSRYIPILSVAYYNQELFYSSILATKNLKMRHRFDLKGNFQYPDKTSFDGASLIHVTDTVHFTNRDINQIDSICRINNINLIYYLNPVFNTSSFVNDSNGKVIINHRDLIDSQDYFYDRVHTVGKGTRSASIALANILDKDFF